MPLTSVVRDEIVRLVTAELDGIAKEGLRTLTPISEIAKGYGLGWRTVTTCLEEAGVSLPPGERDGATLVRLVEEELEQFERGETEVLSTYEQLAERIGFTAGHVRRLLHAEGLNIRRRQAQQASRTVQLAPSDDLAWLLGLLTRGYTGERESIVSYGSATEALLAEFKRCGERVFNLPADRMLMPERVNGKRTTRIVFRSRPLFHAIGDLRTTVWAETLTVQHPWLMRDSRYVWRFLSGYMDAGGSVYQHHIAFHTKSMAGAIYLIEALARVGVRHPKLKVQREAAEDVAGVVVYNPEDRRRLAAHLHCYTPTKAAALRVLRKPPTSRKKFTAEEVIAEWHRLRCVLGATPKAKDIAQLHKERRTRFSTSVFIDHFGDGTWVSARHALESIIAEREGSPAPAPVTKRRRRSKPSRVTDKEELITEWSHLRHCLGHPPSSNDVEQMRRRGETPFGRTPYTRCFSQDHRFTTASAALEAIIAIREARSVPASRRFAPRQELEAAWDTIVRDIGKQPTYDQVLWRYRRGQTPYEPSDYGLCFGTFRRAAAELALRLNKL